MNKEVYDCPLWQIKLDTEPFSSDLVSKVKNTLEVKGNDDPETAHYLEDELYKKFIVTVANQTLSNEQLVGIAKELVKFDDIRFSRWYA